METIYLSMNQSSIFVVFLHVYIPFVESSTPDVFLVRLFAENINDKTEHV